MGRRAKHDYSALYDMYVDMLLTGRIMNLKDFSLLTGVNYDLIRKWFWRIAVERYSGVLGALGYRVKLSPYTVVLLETMRRRGVLREFVDACMAGDLEGMAGVLVRGVDAEFISRHFRSVVRLLRHIYSLCTGR